MALHGSSILEHQIPSMRPRMRVCPDLQVQIRQVEWFIRCGTWCFFYRALGAKVGKRRGRQRQAFRAIGHDSRPTRAASNGKHILRVEISGGNSAVALRFESRPSRAPKSPKTRCQRFGAEPVPVDKHLKSKLYMFEPDQGGCCSAFTVRQHV